LLTASVAVASSELPVEPRVLSLVQNATRSFIDERMVDGVYLYYDVAADELKHLEFKLLHPHTLQAVAHMTGPAAAAPCTDAS
jgi:hypothetical protein